jgi:hypothetical protein
VVTITPASGTPLRHRELGWRARQGENEVVELTPDHVPEELGDELGHHRTTPDDRGALADEHAHRDRTDAKAFGRDDATVLANRRGAFDSEHHGDARPVDVGVEEAHRRPWQPQARLGDRGLPTPFPTP